MMKKFIIELSIETIDKWSKQKHNRRQDVREWLYVFLCGSMLEAQSDEKQNVY